MLLCALVVLLTSSFRFSLVNCTALNIGTNPSDIAEAAKPVGSAVPLANDTNEISSCQLSNRLNKRARQRQRKKQQLQQLKSLPQTVQSMVDRPKLFKYPDTKIGKFLSSVVADFKNSSNSYWLRFGTNYNYEVLDLIEFQTGQNPTLSALSNQRRDNLILSTNKKNTPELIIDYYIHPWLLYAFADYLGGQIDSIAVSTYRWIIFCGGDQMEQVREVKELFNKQLLNNQEGADELFNKKPLNQVGTEMYLYQLRRIVMEARGKVAWQDITPDVVLALRDYLLVLQPKVEKVLERLEAPMNQIFLWNDGRNTARLGTSFRKFTSQLCNETSNRAQEAGAKAEETRRIVAQAETAASSNKFNIEAMGPLFWGAVLGMQKAKQDGLVGKL